MFSGTFAPLHYETSLFSFHGDNKFHQSFIKNVIELHSFQFYKKDGD